MQRIPTTCASHLCVLKHRAVKERQSSACDDGADRGPYTSWAESCGLCCHGHGEEQEARVETTWFCSTCCPEMFCTNECTSYQEIFHTMQLHRMEDLTTVPLTALCILVVNKVQNIPAFCTSAGDENLTQNFKGQIDRLVFLAPPQKECLLVSLGSSVMLNIDPGN